MATKEHFKEASTFAATRLGAKLGRAFLEDDNALRALASLIAEAEERAIERWRQERIAEDERFMEQLAEETPGK